MSTGHWAIHQTQANAAEKPRLWPTHPETTGPRTSKPNDSAKPTKATTSITTAIRRRRRNERVSRTSAAAFSAHIVVVIAVVSVHAAIVPPTKIARTPWLLVVTVTRLCSARWRAATGTTRSWWSAKKRRTSAGCDNRLTTPNAAKASAGTDKNTVNA